MIPILFEATETAFLSNGLGRLSDAISCTVEEELNGSYELVMVYPVTGVHYEDILIDRIIYAEPSDGEDPEPFQVYKISKPLNQRVTVNAEHISYRLSKMTCMPFTEETCALALQGLKTHSVEECDFNFHTDKMIDGRWTFRTPTSIRALLGGTQGSILQRFKGEYKWTGFDVWLYTHRGSDNGVTIRYGKNLQDLKQEENIQDTITGVVPFWANDETVVTLPEGALYSDNAGNFPYPRTIPLDLSERFEEEPTVEELRSAGQAYITENKIGVPKINIEVSFIPLWQTEEYKNIASLERVKLGDTVTVIFEKLGVNASAEVIKTSYDVLTGRYNSIEVGDMKSNLAQTISGISEQTAEAAITNATGAITAQIDNAVTKLAGGLGGHIVYGLNADGLPNELYAMDTDNVQTASKVIRLNMAGLGFSTNGINGPYNGFLSIDGVLDFSQIETVNLLANYIRGGVLSLGGLNNTNGILRIYNNENALIGELNVDGLKMYGSDGGYVLMNQSVGFAGFDKNDAKIYWADGQEFHMKKSVIEEEITLCNMMRFIPITLYDGGGNVTNQGIALVSARTVI